MVERLAGGTQTFSDRFVRWVWFGALAAVLPFALNWLLAAGEAGGPPGYIQLLSGGELLVTCVPLCLTALGELIGRNPSSRSRSEISAAAITVIIAIVCSAWFASLRTGGSFSDGVVAMGSTALFLATIAAAGSCVGLTELGAQRSA